jgi:hypothetical protein
MERDFPIGHPAAADYKGEVYIPLRAPHLEDYPKGSPARGGHNCSDLDSPDGRRVAVNGYHQDLNELAAIAALPPVIDSATGDRVQLSPQQLANVYAVRNGLSEKRADAITTTYGLRPATTEGSRAATTLSPEDQAVLYFIDLGYTPERAKELLGQYGAPHVLSEIQNDTRR